VQPVAVTGPEVLDQVTARHLRYVFCKISGSLAMFAAICRVSSRVNRLAAGPIAVQPSLDEHTLEGVAAAQNLRTIR
jgi:hypothetical protein